MFDNLFDIFLPNEIKEIEMFYLKQNVRPPCGQFRQKTFPEAEVCRAQTIIKYDNIRKYDLSIYCQTI